MPATYQLKLTLRNVSPMVWRRLLVNSGTTLYWLHRAIQVLMNWDDDYLYQFKLFARQFSCRAVSCEDDRAVRLKDFRLRVGERFLYEYNFFCFWQVDIRLEAVLPLIEDAWYPRCVAGKGDPPPEDIGGPVAYMVWSDNRFSSETMDAVYTLSETAQPLLKALIDGDEQAYRSAHEDFKAKTASEEYELALQQYRHSAWHRDNTFKRRTVNRRLKETFSSTSTA